MKQLNVNVGVNILRNNKAIHFKTIRHMDYMNKETTI